MYGGCKRGGRWRVAAGDCRFSGPPEGTSPLQLSWAKAPVLRLEHRRSRQTEANRACRGWRHLHPPRVLREAVNILYKRILTR